MSCWQRLLLMGLALTAAGGNSASAAGSMSMSEELDADYAYVGDSTMRGHGVAGVSVDEQSADVKFVVSPQVTRDLLLRIGAEWQRLSFGVPGRAPIPDVLQQISAVIGCDYQLAEKWIVRAEVQPGIYSDFTDTGWNDFAAPFVLGGVCLAENDLQWFLGLRVDARSRYPVLPAAGMRWRFADEWTLNFMLPRPRLTCDVTENLQFYLGADIEAGTFRVGDNFGTEHGQPRLNGALLDYLEIRLGPGCSWKVLPNLTLEAGAGYVPYRSFDFFNADVTFRSHGAVYGQITCHARF